MLNQLTLNHHNFYTCYRGYNYLEHNGTSWMSHTLPVCDVSNCPCDSRAQLGTYKRSFARDLAGTFNSYNLGRRSFARDRAGTFNSYNLGRINDHLHEIEQVLLTVTTWDV